jgi:hypothetical protein
MAEPMECSPRALDDDDDTARRVFKQRRAPPALIAFLVGARGDDAAGAARAAWTMARGARLDDAALVDALLATIR